MSEPTLFTPPPADGKLTARQAHALDLLEHHPAGLRATDVGVDLHQAFNNPCSCGPAGACKWAMAAGLDVLRALKRRGLVRQRKGGSWQHHASASRPSSEGGRRDAGYDPATAPWPEGF